MTRYSLSALVAAGLLAGGFAASSASAADLGGDCCADLEERVAELEATTARKGNRKVSLTISGFVAQQVLYWDDGVESNVYVTDTGSFSIGSHFKLSGEAQIAPGWSAGYAIRIETINNDSLGVSQNTDEGGNAFAGTGSFSLESSYWFLKSDQLGRLSVGQQSSAADNQAILPDGSGTLVQANYVLYDVNGFFLRNSDGSLSNLTYGSIANCTTLDGAGGVSADCDGTPNNNVRYDTPTFAGFSASASWGEDDDWAVSGRYAGEFSGFKIAAAVAYNETTDGFDAGDSAAALQVGGYIQHVPTGLFVYGAYGKEYIDGEVFTTPPAAAFRTKPEGENWYVKAGIRQKWTPLGHTVLYGEYGENDDKISNDNFAAGITASNLTQYGVGVVQEIDAAAMSLWLSWRHYDAEVTCDGVFGSCATGAGIGGNLSIGENDFEDFDLIKAGALIAF